MSMAVAVVEGVADALVGGGGLAVDAVGVDLEREGDAHPARRATSVAGIPTLSHRETAAYRRSQGGEPGCRRSGGRAARLRRGGVAPNPPDLKPPRK